MNTHKDEVMQKFEDFKKYFGQNLNLVGDAIDSFQIIIQKNGFNLEEKLHGKSLTRVKKAVLELLIKDFNTFKEDLKIYYPEGLEEFEFRTKRSLEIVDKDLLNLDNY